MTQKSFKFERCLYIQSQNITHHTATKTLPDTSTMDHSSCDELSHPDDQITSSRVQLPAPCAVSLTVATSWAWVKVEFPVRL